MNLQSDHKNYLKVTYYDLFDEKWKKFHISMDEVLPEDEKLFREDLDSALQSILVEIERQKIQCIIKDELRRS